MREEVTHKLRADFSKAREDMTIDFDWATFTKEDHAMWRQLFPRQMETLKNRACKEYLDGIKKLGFAEENGIPNFERISDKLQKLTGWRLVVVPGYLPGDVFHTHLSKRQFPVTTFIRTPEQIDYLKEPDIFHDMFGHVPMLAHPVFADYMHAFGCGGVKAHKHNFIDFLDTLYWFTIEFGLINTPEGVRIYGSGIVSSKGESIYCLEKRPNQIAYDLKRIMRSKYRIDTYQATYFVIDSFEQLMESTKPNFLPIYQEVSKLSSVPIGEIIPEDKVIQRGSDPQK